MKDKKSKYISNPFLPTQKMKKPEKGEFAAWSKDAILPKYAERPGPSRQVQVHAKDSRPDSHYASLHHVEQEEISPTSKPQITSKLAFSSSINNFNDLPDSYALEAAPVDSDDENISHNKSKQKTHRSTRIHHRLNESKHAISPPLPYISPAKSRCKKYDVSPCEISPHVTPKSPSQGSRNEKRITLWPSFLTLRDPAMKMMHQKSSTKLQSTNGTRKTPTRGEKRRADLRRILRYLPDSLVDFYVEGPDGDFDEATENYRTLRDKKRRLLKQAHQQRQSYGQTGQQAHEPPEPQSQQPLPTLESKSNRQHNTHASTNRSRETKPPPGSRQKPIANRNRRVSKRELEEHYSMASMDLPLGASASVQGDARETYVNMPESFLSAPRLDDLPPSKSLKGKKARTLSADDTPPPSIIKSTAESQKSTNKPLPQYPGKPRLHHLQTPVGASSLATEPSKPCFATWEDIQAVKANRKENKPQAAPDSGWFARKFSHFKVPSSTHHRSEADKFSSKSKGDLKSQISSPQPMLAERGGGVNIAVESGGVGGPGAAFSVYANKGGQPSRSKREYRPQKPSSSIRPQPKHDNNVKIQPTDAPSNAGAPNHPPLKSINHPVVQNTRAPSSTARHATSKLDHSTVLSVSRANKIPRQATPKPDPPLAAPSGTRRREPSHHATPKPSKGHRSNPSWSDKAVEKVKPSKWFIHSKTSEERERKRKSSDASFACKGIDNSPASSIYSPTQSPNDPFKRSGQDPAPKKVGAERSVQVSLHPRYANPEPDLLPRPLRIDRARHQRAKAEASRASVRDTRFYQPYDDLFLEYQD